MLRTCERCSGASLMAVIWGACALLAGTAACEDVEMFILWGLRGRWHGHIEIEEGRLIKLEPYSFELQYGDSFNGADDRRASWRSGVLNQFDGIHFTAAVSDATLLRLELLGEAVTLKPNDFPADTEKKVELKGDNRFLILGRGDPARGPKTVPRESELPATSVAPSPRDAVSLPKRWWEAKQEVGIGLPERVKGGVLARRVSNGDSRLYVEILPSEGTLSGRVAVGYGERRLGERNVDGSLWLSLEPRLDTIDVAITCPGEEGMQLRVPTALVETRGRQLYLNGEPFLVKGTLPRDLNDEDAAYLKSLGANTLRTRQVIPQLAKFGFMALGVIHRGPGHICQKPYPREKFVAEADRYVDTVAKYAPEWVTHPNLLIAQLGNEQAFTMDAWAGRYGHNRYSRLDYLLARCYNAVKPLCPMIPCSYSNNAVGYRAPDFLEVYAHNTYLSTDRGVKWPPLPEFMKWEGCDRRPFVMSEWGANVYMPELYRFGPIFPVLEKIHMWNYPNRWRTFIDAGACGGTNYCLYDYDLKKARRQVKGEWDKGFSKFGVMTFERQPKLAVWELWHIWRDFEVSPNGADELSVRYIRDYWARDCKLTVETVAGEKSLVLTDFGPQSNRVVPMPAGVSSRFRWRIDYSTHGGLPRAATGGHPRQIEVDDFMARLEARDTYRFLKELFDAEVVAADGRADVATLAELEREDGVVPVVFRKPNGVVYLTVFHRRRPMQGWYHDGVTVDVSFRGVVIRVDELSGEPLDLPVSVQQTAVGLRLRDLRVPFLPKGYTARAPERIELPVYRITPGS